MHYANVGGSLHHLLTKQQCVELQGESSDHSLGSDMVYLNQNLLICEPYTDPLGALQSFDLMLRHRDHQTSAAYFWDSFCADSCRYFLTVVGIVLSHRECD